jgi:hypothetical protein
VDTAPDSIAQPLRGAANHGVEIVALFQDHDGLGAPHFCRDVAQLVLTTSWTVQIGQTDRDAIDAFLVALTANSRLRSTCFCSSSFHSRRARTTIFHCSLLSL